MKRISVFICLLAAIVPCGCDKAGAPAPQPTPYDRTGEKDVIVKTVDAEAYVIGDNHEDGTYAGSVFNRLVKRAGAFDDNTTRVVAVFNLAGLTRDEYLAVFDCYANGGVVVLVEPDVDIYNSFRRSVAEAASLQLIDRYNTAGINVGKWVDALYEKLFSCLTIGYKGADVTYECLAFCRKDRFLCPKMHDKAGGAQNGLSAEALVDWIDRELDGNRGGILPDADDEYPDISSPEYCQSVTISCSSPKILDGKLTAPYADVVNICLKWSVVYSQTAYNRDYYFFKEDVTVNGANVEPVPDASDNAKWHYIKPVYEISYIDGLEDRMELMMRGESGELINNASDSYAAIQYHPHSANPYFDSNVVTEEPPVQPVYISGNLGSVRPCLAGESGSFKELFAESVKQRGSFFCTAGERSNISGIEVISEARYNYSNFRYFCREPYVGIIADSAGDRYIWDLEPSQISTCTQHNSFYMRTDSPVGIPLMRLYGKWKIRRVSRLDVSPYWESYGSDVYIGQHENYIDLGRPYRCIQKWTVNCIGYGDLTDTSSPDIQEFEERWVSDLCPENCGRTANVGGYNEEDNYEANLLFNRFMEDFERMSGTYADLGYTGRFTFSFEPESGGQMLVKSFEIKK
ncbi:MAG: hypothetical protein MJY44_02175 [Bacteroidales bacterium]|nr:hypothetical protein [Bacteroidales bacterium]